MARDPILLAMVQHRLDAITRQMGWVMTRTASSPVFTQSHDFSCFITTPDGTLAANADGLPIHTGGGGFAVRALIGYWGDDMAPGDVFVLSDPYLAGGNHLPDWVIARPVFVTARRGTKPVLAGFCCNRAHQSDIGGGVLGTYNPEATDIFHEGIRLTPLRLYERGGVRHDLWDLLIANSRTPELLDGDLRAMIGSARIGAERVEDLVEELGVDRYLDHLDGILDHAERRFRAVIYRLPDGVYHGEDGTDNDCFETVDIRIRVAVTISGDEMTVDFTGTDPQMKGFKNSAIANTHSAVYMALSSFIGPEVPRNEGTYRPVEIIAPAGSVVNAQYPAPLTMSTVYVAHEMIHAIWQALSQADPARSIAGWSKTVHGHVAGTHEGRPFILYHWQGLGAPGGSDGRDGFNQMGHLVTLGGLDLPNLEFYEQMYPVRYRRWEFRCDAAGPGKFRGGTGVHYEVDVFEPGLWSFRAESLGIATGHPEQGGGWGGPGEVTVVPLDEGDVFVPPKYGVRHLGPARYIAATPGGGGWGDPLLRDPAAVLRDVMDGVVSIEAAERDYGVVIAGEPMTVNLPATITLRGGRVGDAQS